MRTIVALAVLLVSPACNRPSAAPSESLVGATELPPASVLSRETIQINQWGGPRRRQFLSYELRPNNSVTVTHSLDQAQEQIAGREILRLSSNAAAEVRKKLWAVRPQALRGVQYDTLPMGCHMIMDVGYDAAVAFIGPEQQIGVFTLPPPGICKSHEATKARQAIKDALKLMTSKVATNFSNAS